MNNIHQLIFGLLVMLSLSACDKTDQASEKKPEVMNTHAASESLNGKENSQSHTLSKQSLPKSAFKEIEWTDLLPDDDLFALENPPDYLADIEDGSKEDQLSSQLKAENRNVEKGAVENRYQQALSSKKIRPEFDGRHIRIPGFIVPLEFDDHQTITTFFLVPFFGACIHMPPPPPNQIIYAEYEPGIRLEALYDPFWINGTLSTTLMENDMATAAYSITVSAIEPYTEESSVPDESEQPM